MTLSQALFHQQTFFAIVLYCIAVIMALYLFTYIHKKLDNNLLQYAWDKIGVPLIRACLIVGLILLVYPVNFGIESAPSIHDLLAVDGKRTNFLVNIIFLLTFAFPLIPVLGKWEELIIPLQGILASMIIFRWLCHQLEIEHYSLFPDINTWFFILIISLITHWLAKYVSAEFGEYLDELYHREGFQVLVFKAVVLIMQSPVIFIFGLALGKQLSQELFS